MSNDCSAFEATTDGGNQSGEVHRGSPPPSLSSVTSPCVVSPGCRRRSLRCTAWRRSLSHLLGELAVMESGANVVCSLKETDDVECVCESDESSRWATVSGNAEVIRGSHPTRRSTGSGPAAVGVRKTHTSAFAIAPEPSRNEKDGHQEAGTDDTQVALTPSRARRLGHSWVRSLLVLLIVAVTCLCLVWTVWLGLLTVAQNDTVNRVMATEDFDYGSFWLLITSPPTLVGLAIFGLSVVALGFLSIPVVMVKRWKRTDRVSAVGSSSRMTERLDSMKHDVEIRLARTTQRSNSRVISFGARTVSMLIENDSSTRKLLKVWLKVADMCIQTVLLFQILETGSPIPLVAMFTAIVGVNALSCAIMMMLPFQQTGVIEVLIDTTFDFLVAVGYPMLVLLYCLSTFDFDRGVLAINLEVFPPTSFEHVASVIADPVQTAIVYKSLKALRINSVLDLLTTVGVNLVLCFHLHRVAVLVKDPQMGQPSVYPKRHRGAIAFFVAFAILIVIFAEESVRTSSLACKPHPECVVNARRWTFVRPDSLTQCPCLMLIDGDKAPKTFAEWEQPRNLTDKVAQLATMGKLETIQLTNRYLPTLPEEL